jgi:hypothetical protein
MTAISLPGKLLRFLEHEATMAFAGTRDQQLVPYGHRVSGWFVENGGQSMVALIPEASTTNLIDSLQNNGELVLTIGEFPSHETYQFKGRYLRHWPVRPQDAAVVDRIRERLFRSARHFFDDPERLVNTYVHPSAVAVAFEIREVFVQTPGPGAGARIVPPAEAPAL